MRRLISSSTVRRYTTGVTDESIARLNTKLKHGPYDTDVARFRSKGEDSMRLSAAKKKESEQVFENAVKNNCEVMFDQALKLEEEWKSLLKEGENFFREAEKTEAIIQEGRHFANYGSN